MSSTLDHLKKHTIIVADTGDFNSIKKYLPIDSTTNPSLILSACKLPQYSHLLDSAIQYAKKERQTLNEQIELALERIFVLFGCEILKIVPGRVSTEVDARYSFNVQKQIEIACRLISMYEELGFSKERILIKLSSTWEGIKAAKILESQYGIHCNLTLMFSFYQAIACAQANVTLISPFVGRVLDWYITKYGKKEYTRHNDPGVNLVTRIYNYYKFHGYKTQIMGASFRNVEQILGLVGCDLLTISPSLLEELSKMSEVPSLCLTVEKAQTSYDHSYQSDELLTEEEFRWQMNEDEMANDKLTDGIRRFTNDALILKDLIKTRMEQQ
ncbi:Transaldolase [Schistosoma haematobium]|uniref:Transaldolase n=1 Tax=Schistosoma haematobium TaxID=6185 RepID=A0A6A5DZR9_SCHHA|nr:Transaldolase [Schistosoma haematobium]KAH9580889.1 Transaldolase [Schistosoma haematobium]